MKTFPMFLQMAGRRVVIAGGGEQAAQKARLILKTEAQIEVLAQELDPELADLAAAGRVTHRAGPITPASFADTALVFVATGCPGLDMALHALAKAAGATVNVVDQPDLCDALTPSIVDRDPVVVAIGTEGTAPVLARQIKTKLEETLEPRLGDLAALAGRLRHAAAARLAPRARRDLWRWVFNDTPRRMFTSGAERDAAKLIKTAIDTGEFGTSHGGCVSLVGAGPGAKDLITLRGVQRLQEADVIYYDRLLDPEILELARRDAERVYVGKAPGCHSWPQEKITQTLVAAAKRGQRVVRLKCGDPGVFGRSTEEMDALRADGIPVEIVPGVTAACAAAASAGQSLTDRGVIETVVLTTGHRKDGYAIPDQIKGITPGTCVALYMAVGLAPSIVDTLTLQHPDVAFDVQVVAKAQRKGQTLISCALSDLAKAITTNDIAGEAMIFVRWPRDNVQSQNHGGHLSVAS
ncbi:uroporphyrin-III C-methyltransferase / precorrin-2 dehydrogenase / sirohydrochlorin ferrochelatase [Cognatiyoonia koreensis]|uniref:Uroporphyrin-III C-methyltransferase / precorrin-2 dehydrogenase / sirohydrochlorin ferrochelatase n=1 Tax=Cognatiyoonia koreensis TaxID=364200 RepID=A0A1I0MXC5_9RHOB|nr:siroheme synthase CysG [Cognatiyoonia koreensis]SEV93458.1 uroporphyrin-III C-methyltransferase / precorrin-2 dehydrogenase / sirohydrochlorin ferrochelatase [Cognatiyoonia koreensis]